MLTDLRRAQTLLADLALSGDEAERSMANEVWHLLVHADEVATSAALRLYACHELILEPSGPLRHCRVAGCTGTSTTGPQSHTGFLCPLSPHYDPERA